MGAFVSTDLTLQKIIERLMNEFNPLRIILFGSRAHGVNRSDSDYDLVVIVRNSSEDWLERCQRANRILRGCGASIDVLVVTENEFKTKVQEDGSIYQIASTEGVELLLD